MYKRIGLAGQTVSKLILPVAVLMALVGCASQNDKTSWENVHDGLLIGNIYTGDDHI